MTRLQAFEENHRLFLDQISMCRRMISKFVDEGREPSVIAHWHKLLRRAKDDERIFREAALDDMPEAEEDRADRAYQFQRERRVA